MATEDTMWGATWPTWESGRTLGGWALCTPPADVAPLCVRKRRFFKFLLGEVAIRRKSLLSRKSEAEVVEMRSPPFVRGFGEVGDRMDE